MHFLIVFLIGVFGASIGSFLNVVIYRLPAGLSLLHPPSRCPHCLHRLGPSENVPVLGWLWLRGRCRHCRAPISSRYPLVEATTGLLFLLVFAIFGLSGQTIGYWVLLSWLLALALIDLDTMTLPNPLTQSGLVLGLGFQTWMGLQLQPSWAGAASGFMVGVFGVVLGMWLLEILALVMALALGKPAMGGGDIKLAAMIGAWLGWERLLLSLFLAAAVGTVVSLGAIVLKRLKRSQRFPFGPFLAIGAFYSALWGDRLWAVYVQLLF